MRDDHPTDQASAIERQARGEWELLLARLRAAAGAEVRHQRLRQAILSGEFQVDARAVANRLIARFLTS